MKNNSKQNGFSYKNYMIESSITMVIKAARMALIASITPVLVSWAVLFSAMGIEQIRSSLVLLFVCSSIFGLAGWLACFGFMMRMGESVAYYGDREQIDYEKYIAELEQETMLKQVKINLYQLEDGNYKLIENWPYESSKSTDNGMK